MIGDLTRVEASLRWLLGDTDVHTAIVGTTNIQHLQDNIDSVGRGPLPNDTTQAIAAAS